MEKYCVLYTSPWACQFREFPLFEKINNIMAFAIKSNADYVVATAIDDLTRVIYRKATVL